MPLKNLIKSCTIMAAIAAILAYSAVRITSAHADSAATLSFQAGSADSGNLATGDIQVASFTAGGPASGSGTLFLQSGDTTFYAGAFTVNAVKSVTPFSGADAPDQSGDQPVLVSVQITSGAATQDLFISDPSTGVTLDLTITLASPLSGDAVSYLQSSGHGLVFMMWGQSAYPTTAA